MKLRLLGFLRGGQFGQGLEGGDDGVMDSVVGFEGPKSYSSRGAASRMILSGCEKTRGGLGRACRWRRKLQPSAAAFAFRHSSYAGSLRIAEHERSGRKMRSFCCRRSWGFRVRSQEMARGVRSPASPESREVKTCRQMSQSGGSVG